MLIKKDEKMLFLLVGALASLFLPPKRGFQQVYGPAIWLAGCDLKVSIKLLFFQTG